MRPTTIISSMSKTLLLALCLVASMFALAKHSPAASQPNHQANWTYLPLVQQPMPDEWVKHYSFISWVHGGPGQMMEDSFLSVPVIAEIKMELQ